MPTVKRSVAAQRDLDAIVDFIAADSPLAADHWFDGMDRVFHLLATQPAAGERVETRRFGMIRRHAHGNYVIYYRPLNYGVYILRVLHGARDQGPLL